MHRTWADVSLTALRQNFQNIRTRVGPSVAVMAVVKADAYGHGASTVAKTLADAGAAWMGVSSATEGVELRAAGITQPILLLSGHIHGDEEALSEHSLTPLVSDPAQIEQLEQRKIPYHLKIDTGMGRLGVRREILDGILPRIGPACEGIATHFASSSEPTMDQNDEQVAQFRAAQAAMAAAGLRPRWVHAANSAAIASRRDCWGNMVRPGIALYGYVDTPDTIGLKPVLSLKTRILTVKDLPPGSPVGYSARYVTKSHQRIAAAGAGYADGINRALTNRGAALVRGHRVPIVGAVSMDITLLDVTHVPEVAPGDIATFIGVDGSEQISADEIAKFAGTIRYEILCHIGRRVPRLYTND